MTSPGGFVDRVEYQVIGRDINASGVFRDVANEADRAGDEIDSLRATVDRFGDDIDIASARLRAMLAVLADISDVDLPNLTIGDVDAGALAELESIIGEIAAGMDRTGTATNALGGDFRALSGDVDQAGTRVVAFGDALATVDDNRAAITVLRGDFAGLPADIQVATDGIARFSDTLETVDDNRGAITGLGSDFRGLRADVDGTRVGVDQLNGSLATIDDNNRVPALGQRFRDLATDIDLARTRLDELSRIGRGLDDLGVRIGQLGDHVRDLERQIREIDIRDINVDRSAIRSSLLTAGLVGGAALAAGIATGATIGMITRVGPAIQLAALAIKGALSSVGGGIGFAIGGTVLLGLVSWIGSAIGGAILGGIGIGGVIGGLALAAQDQRVKDAAKRTADGISGVFQLAAASFVPAAIRALDTVRAEVQRMYPEFRRLFDSAVPFVQPLTEGLLGFIRNMLPGLTTAMRNLKPVIDQIVAWMPKLGTTVGKFFADISTHAPAMAHAFGMFLGLLNTSIRIIGLILQGMAFVYNQIKEIIPVIQVLMGFVPGKILDWVAGTGEDTEKILALKSGVQDLGNAFTNTGNSADVAAGQAANLLSSLEQVASAAQSSRMAASDFQGGLDQLSASVRTNGTTLDITSEKGRANQAVIESLISAADRAGQAAEEQARATGAGAAAAAAAGAKMRSTYIRDLESAARKAGLNEQAIANMVAELKAADGERARMFMDVIKRHWELFMKPGTSPGGIGGSWFKGAALGGPVVGPGPKGIDSELRVLAPGEHVLTSREVDAAGGHEAIFALRRSLMQGTATTSMDGGGQTVAPSRSGGGRSSAMDVERLAAALRHAFSGMTLRIDDRSGRTAQLIARGG